MSAELRIVHTVAAGFTEGRTRRQSACPCAPSATSSRSGDERAARSVHDVFRLSVSQARGLGGGKVVHC